MEQDLKTVIDKVHVLLGEFTKLSSKLKELEEKHEARCEIYDIDTRFFSNPHSRNRSHGLTGFREPPRF